MREGDIERANHIGRGSAGINEYKCLGLINLSAIHEFVSVSRKLVQLNESSKMVCKIMYNLVMALKNASYAVDETMRVRLCMSAFCASRTVASLSWCLI